MKSSTKISTFLTSTLGILTFKFALSLPASANIICELNTISKYANGSLSSCKLAYDTFVQRYDSRYGTLSFNCQEKEYIHFDEKGQIKSCQLAQEISINQGNYIQKCLSDYKINISENEQGLSVSCY